MKAVTCDQPGAGEQPARSRTRPSRRGAGEPGEGAEGLAGGDDPVGRGRRPASARAGLSEQRRRRARRSAATGCLSGGSSSNQSRVSRAAPSGSETRDVGLLVACRRPARASRRRCRGTISCPALQPNQRRTARKVSRASSSPVSTCSSTPVSFAHPLRAPRPRCVASRTAEVAKASSSSQPSSSASRCALRRRPRRGRLRRRR